MATSALPDIVRISKLDTQFFPDLQRTQHVKFVTGNSSRERRIRKEELWSKERNLGRGGFALVWLERCVGGDDKRKLRAVKQVQKLDDSDYRRELEAITLFSHSKASLLPYRRIASM